MVADVFTRMRCNKTLHWQSTNSGVTYYSKNRLACHFLFVGSHVLYNLLDLEEIRYLAYHCRFFNASVSVQFTKLLDFAQKLSEHIFTLNLNFFCFVF